jgi:mannose/fructose/N-acetylgalactosamine-specific phosphotransferase system component IID
MACDIFDIGCKTGEAIVGIILPYILPAILVLVALFILPRAGKKGWILALLVVIGVVAWYVGVPGLIPPLRQGFGY